MRVVLLSLWRQGKMLAMATTSPTSIPVADRVHNFTYAIRNIVAEARAVEATGKKVRAPEHRRPDPLRVPDPPALVEIVMKAMRDGGNGYVPSPGIQPARDAVAEEWSAPWLSGLARPRPDHGGHLRRHRAGADGAGEPGRPRPGAIADLPALHGGALAKIGADPAFYRTDPARGWILTSSTSRA